MAIGLDLEEKKRGDFLPVLKFDAKAGDFIAVNREPQSDGTWEKSEVEIATPFKAVVDFHNMQKGWISFKPGAVDFTMVHVEDKLPAQPTPDHKQGVRFRMFFKEHGLREFSHTSKNVLRAINALHDEFISGASKNAGKLPVVEVSGTETVKMQTKDQGELRFKIPKWRVSAWIDPPEGMGGEEKPAAPASKPMPAAKPAPAPAVDEEF